MVLTSERIRADQIRAMRAHGWIREMSNKADIASANPGIDPRFLFLHPGGCAGGRRDRLERIRSTAPGSRSSGKARIRMTMKGRVQSRSNRASIIHSFLGLRLTQKTIRIIRRAATPDEAIWFLDPAPLAGAVHDFHRLPCCQVADFSTVHACRLSDIYGRLNGCRDGFGGGSRVRSLCGSS